MTVKDFCKVMPYNVKLRVKDRFSGKVLFEGYCPSQNKLDGVEWSDFNVYHITCEHDGSFIFVVSIFRKVS